MVTNPTKHILTNPFSKRVGVKCEFKLKASERTIRYASDEEAKEAGDRAIKKYSETFKELAKFL